MKRYILWRPFIVDMRNTRLPYGKPVEFSFEFKRDGENPPSQLDVVVTYHLLDEKRRKKSGYENRAPIAYPILPGNDNAELMEIGDLGQAAKAGHRESWWCR